MTRRARAGPGGRVTRGARAGVLSKHRSAETSDYEAHLSGFHHIVAEDVDQLVPQ